MYNHVALLGRLAQDPKLMSTQTGKQVARFDLAVPGYNKDAPPDYIPIVCWQQTADFVGRYLTKGRQIVVAGELKTNKYTDKEGVNRKEVYVRASNIYFADSNRADNGGQPAQQEAQTVGNTQSTPPGGYVQVDDEELPF